MYHNALYMPIEIFKKELIEAEFIDRPNRFIVNCLLNKKNITAYLPNPGKLLELLIKGAKTYLIKGKSTGINYKMVAVLKDSIPVMVDTHVNNIALKELLMRGLIRGFEKYDDLREEVRVGKSRFDFIIQKNSQINYIEAKSCTLFGQNIAMFPDAVTSRGNRHLRELVELSKNGNQCHVIFVAHSPRVCFFMPDFHTDLDFSKTFLNVEGSIHLKAIGLKWTDNLQLSEDIHELIIPFYFLKNEIQDRGAYLLIVELEADKEIRIGALGNIFFKKGNYVYVGSAMRELTKRINRHKRKTKNIFWHIDYLLQEARLITCLPIRSSEKLECAISEGMKEISSDEINGFGSSDCNCKSHLFYFKNNPVKERSFIDRLVWFRIDRIIKYL